VRWVKFGKSAGGPVATDNLGDGEKRAPVVDQAIESAGWQLRIAGGQGVLIVFGPASEFAGNDFFDVGAMSIETSGDLSGLGGNQGNQDGAVVECGREHTDAGQYDRGKSRKQRGQDGLRDHGPPTTGPQGGGESLHGCIVTKCRLHSEYQGMKPLKRLGRSGMERSPC
jgi:hypothetical protein